MSSTLASRVALLLVTIGLVVAGLVTLFAPAAPASAAERSAGGGLPASPEPCPEGYKGVIVGTSGGAEVYACTNILP